MTDQDSELQAAQEDPQGYQCCFCGKAISEQGNDPLVISFSVDKRGGLQQVYCHTACLRSRLHSSVPLALDD
jgi:hypothetical protein